MQTCHLVRQVEQCLAQLGPAPGGCVVAVSGGPDSVALLRAVAALRREDRLLVAHLNHQLRGADSDADEAFVARLHAELSASAQNLAFRSARLDVAERARQERGNLESVARRLRYDWLAQVAQDAGLPWVLTGHTADDQAETVLHRLLRGTGLRGLRGIAPRRPLAAGVELVRPLLGVRRADVMAYLQQLGQPFRDDASNANRRFTRNRIRHELLPMLAEHYNPGIVPVLCRLADQAAEAFPEQEAAARALLAAVEKPRAGSALVFDRCLLAAAPRPVIREMFRLAWEREGWSAGRMDFASWDRLAAVALGESAAVDLPGGVRVHGKPLVVLVDKKEPQMNTDELR
jgi:tRNA(Ile)-lysidine synthase